MNIIRLPVGQLASLFSNRIHVWRSASGRYRWSGAAMFGSDAIFATGQGLPNHFDAAADGIAWAQDCGVNLLVIQSTRERQGARRVGIRNSPRGASRPNVEATSGLR